MRICLQSLRDSNLSLNATIVSVNGDSRMHSEPQKLLNFNFYADPEPDPAFHCNADPDPDSASQNNAYPDPQPLVNVMKKSTKMLRWQQSSKYSSRIVTIRVVWILDNRSTSIIPADLSSKLVIR
jgi:hypothetical protein